jgi:hypothetical protein
MKPARGRFTLSCGSVPDGVDVTHLILGDLYIFL